MYYIYCICEVSKCACSMPFATFPGLFCHIASNISLEFFNASDIPPHCDIEIAFFFLFLYIITDSKTKGYNTMPKLLLINIADTDKIRRLVLPMNIQAETVSPASFDKTLEVLASSRQKETPAPIGTDASVFNESLIIFCDVPEKKFDKILFKLRQSKITVDYKAALTLTNSKWTVKRLMMELERECRLMTR